ncbi:hypothetical protein BGZ73_002726 [Actinomortierella ambigua]|nr:hypothetical protein BGZ73_002726 [Actinomortierella ambigua]
MTYEVMPDAIDSHIFYDCADDGRIHRYDIRIRTSCDCEESEICDRHAFINVNSNYPSTRRNLFASAFSPFRFGRQSKLGITAITQRPENPVYIAAACSDDTVRIFDTRMVGSSSNHRDAQVYSYNPFVPQGFVVGSDGELKAGTNTDRSRLSTKITSLKYDPSGSGQLLVSYSRGDCYLIQPSWMGTKEEEQRLQAPSTENVSGGESRTKDKNGKRRRSSDSPEDSDGALEPKTSPRARSSDSYKHASPRMRSIRSDNAGASANKVEDKGETKQQQEEDTEMEMGDTGGTPSHVDKSKKHSRSDAATDRMTRAGQRQLLSKQATTSQQKEEQETAESKDVDMDPSSVPRVSATANVESETRSDNPIGIRLGDLARFHGWGEEVSDNSDSSLDQDEDKHDSDEDEGGDGGGTSNGSAREDKVYWAKRSYRTSRKDTVQIYSGHKNARTMIKEANFYGPNSEFVMSGSDDGRIFFWDKMTGKLENAIRGDRQVVNCIQPHPLSNMLLAASGIDKTIKIFMPTASEHADLSKIRGVRRPSGKSGLRRIVSGAGIMPFAVGSASERDSTEDDDSKKQGSPTSPPAPEPATPPSPHPENELDIQHAFEAFNRDSDDGSDALFSSEDDYDDDGDDDDSDSGHFLGNLQTRYVLEIITQLARASQRAREARAATSSGVHDNDNADGRGNDGDEETGDEHDDEDDVMALG